MIEKMDYESTDLEKTLALKIMEKDKEIEKLNNIINKAIEYLTKCNYNDLKFTSRIYDILLNILKGVDKE